MKGILTDCNSGEKRDVDVSYEVIYTGGKRIFHLIDGVTGDERFCMDRIAQMYNVCKIGWVACSGAKGRYDKLFIPPEDMRYALKPYIGKRAQKVMLEEVVISSCRECKYHGYTESNWYCKKMQLSKYTFQEITDIDSIHELCPLDDFVG